MQDLIDQLRAWARRYDPKSPERRLMVGAADALDGMEAMIETEVTRRLGDRGAGLTVEAVEGALGKRLLPWQRKKLEEQ